MKKRRFWPGWTVVIAVLMGSICSAGLSSSSFEDLSSRQRADVIRIDTMSAFGDREKAPVEFLHEKHTDALSKKNMDCTACHLTQKDRIYPKFKRLKDTDRVEVMNVYHKGCIGCHGEMNVAKEKTGPIECDECHREKERYASSRQPMGLDKSLHFRHLQARDNQCQQCHHEYNEIDKKLFYAKGKEGTCRYCHGQETKGNLISMRDASHIGCINCHIQAKPEKTVKPPVTCTGCHDPAVQENMKKATMIPRIKRNQPDTVLLKSVPQDFKVGQVIGRMNFVPFNHKAHENYNDTCRVCHHQNLESCKACHTLNGSSEGKGVTIEKAAHKPGSERSCLGCHAVKKQTQNCAGCHLVMGSNHKMSDASCLKCHAVPITEIKPSADPDQEKSLVQSVLQSKDRMAETYSADDIPERIIIKRLSDKFEPVDFPHLKIVNALVENIKADKLAGYFHDPNGTICQGCHHISPLSKRPSNCGNCHAKNWDPDSPLKPGILGAYHQQCMGCHEVMNIEKPMGCTECHKEKIASD